MTSDLSGTLLFTLTTAIFSSRIRYLRCNGKYKSNVKIITNEEGSTIQDLIIHEKFPSLMNYNPTILSAIDVHGFLNTSFPVLVRQFYMSFSKVGYNREKLIIHEDGGTVALDHAYIQSLPNIEDSAPIVLIHHGLCGDSNSDYILHTVEVLLQAKYRVIVFIARGCGGLELTSKKTFSASRLHDFETAANKVKSDFPLAKAVFGLSYSLGAGIMLNYLGKISPCILDAAICVSPPWDFMKATIVFPLFSPILAFSIKLYAFTHARSLHLSYVDIIRILFTFTSYQLESFFLQMHEYSSVEEYYFDSSPCYASQNITCPTLAISAEDDPICCHTGSALDFLGTGLAIVKTQTGGHLGFAEDTFLPTSWIEKVALEWYSIVLHSRLSSS